MVAILVNPEKAPLFTPKERMEIAREVFRDRPNVEVETFDGLLVDYARRRRATVIVRGLRAVSDFEYELQMALMNRHLSEDLETVFMMPGEAYTYLSSRLVKEVFALGRRRCGVRPRGSRNATAAEAGCRRSDAELERDHQGLTMKSAGLKRRPPAVAVHQSQLTTCKKAQKDQQC